MQLDRIIDSSLMNEAKNILCNDEDNKLTKEQISRKQIIVAVCLKYKFSYKFINDVVLINSMVDEWYFNFSEDTISLFHRNILQDVNGFHHQKDFKSIIHVLQYVKKHDKFFYKPNNNHKYDIVTRVMNKNK